MYDNLMVAVDNSECSNHAIELAIDLARTTGARLTGTHVYASRLHDVRFRQLEPGLPERYQSEQVLQHWRYAHGDLIDRGLKAVSDSYLDVLERTCNEAGILLERKTLEGRNFEELVKDVRASGYDLVIIGAFGLGRVDRSTIGSVCERVTRLVNSDVLVVREARPLNAGKLLVGIDGSPDSFVALKKALELHRAHRNPILAVAAYDPFFHAAAFKSISDMLSDETGKLFRFTEQKELHDEVIDKGLSKLYHSHLMQAKKIGEARGVHLDIEVIEGKPFDAIAASVEKVHPALLVIGRTGLHRGAGVTLGSNTENLIRCTNCNVLVTSRDAGSPAIDC